MTVDSQDVHLGNAELRVRDGPAIYVAPSLLPHYIASHGYQPPAEVLTAIEQACGPKR